MSEEPDDPFAELDDPEIPDADVDDLFEEMDSPDIDDEEVFEAVFTNASETDDSLESTETETEAVVSKEQYCKKCEYFSKPPEVACNNPGTEIVELVGIDSFRLRNCPVVAERGRAETVLPDENSG